MEVEIFGKDIACMDSLTVRQVMRVRGLHGSHVSVIIMLLMPGASRIMSRIRRLQKSGTAQQGGRYLCLDSNFLHPTVCVERRRYCNAAIKLGLFLLNKDQRSPTKGEDVSHRTIMLITYWNDRQRALR
ncbi:Uncharacterized protein HZ326_28215 [Fusarium oxysporum f. sp. albedinis]|nr:Uncharacterized protein HZ326_28215 [Fusarium oxysporum f. sp. albedinis]